MKNRKVKLSIIIANYNTYKLTLKCVESIYKFSPKFTFEVILIDDASTDGSENSLKKLEKRFKNLYVLQNIKNSGYVKSNNKGLKKSVGEYKLLLNSDTEVKKDSIDNLVDFAEGKDDAGVVGSKLLNLDGSLQESCFNFPTIKNAILEYFFDRKGLFSKFAPTGNLEVVVDAVVGASLLITPQAFMKIGLLDEKYVSYFEDIDYCRKVWKIGLKVYYLPNSVIVHRHGASFSKIMSNNDNWKKLVPSSIMYHGLLKHSLLYLILWIGQKWKKLLKY